jgi:transglutaminase-like putative cysteine protease
VTWRMRVEHESNYEYKGVVHSSYNEARITPLTTTTQLVLESQVDVEPATGPYRYIDYWGSVVHAFDIHLPHKSLRVTGHSVVETTVPPRRTFSLSWEELDSDQIRDDFAELLAPTGYVPVDSRLSDVASQIRAEHTPETAGQAAIDWVRRELAYVAGTTGVHTSAVEAWEGGEGVCQDFAHVALAVARAMGIPARYCSGYLHPNPDIGIGATVEGEGHAWVELWTGDWTALDPTIGWPIGERHVLVARGRDYADVAPIKGVFHGGPTARLHVAVRLQRLG